MTKHSAPRRFVVLPPAVKVPAVAAATTAAGAAEFRAVFPPSDWRPNVLAALRETPGQLAELASRARIPSGLVESAVRRPALKLSPREFPVLLVRVFTRNSARETVAGLGAQQARAVGGPKIKEGAGLKVVKTSPPDGALLVQGDGMSLADVKAKVDRGTKVFEEQWYRLDASSPRWRLKASQYTRPRVKAGHAVTWTVTVHLDDPDRTPLPDVLVTVLVNAAKGIGLEAVTDAHGQARFTLSKHTRGLDSVMADPLHSAWPVATAPLDPQALGQGLSLMVPAIDLNAPDGRNHVYGKAAASAGKGVVVGIVDTGVGPHDDLKVVGGMNTTGEDVGVHWDEQGHGSHVAGVIAASASGWRRGEACKVQLRSYRVFKSGSDEASTFDIATAIKQAAADGCDLINLSVGGPPDGTVKDAIDLAWDAGSVCIAAAGNDGTTRLDYPAQYARVIAVSAFGLQDSWPAGTNLTWTLTKAMGKSLHGMRTFFASFSNRSKKVGLTAPGVAIVSSIFGNRWGVMSGTSMAAPVATGVLARRLALGTGPRDILAMARDGARAQAIVELAQAHAEDLAFKGGRQGHGLAR